jgi:hypothetical protein
MTSPKAAQASSAEPAREWASSPEGQARIQEAIEKSERTVAELRAARRIEPDVLTYPSTV